MPADAAILLAGGLSRRMGRDKASLPFVSEDLLRYLADLDRGAEAAVPLGPRGPEPLLAVYSAGLVPGIRHFLASGERRVGAFLERLQPALVPQEVVQGLDREGRSFLNLYRPGDYKAALLLAELTSS